MMTCRLLCALLVLALCCCPFICTNAVVAETGDPNESLTQSQVQSTGDSSSDLTLDTITKPNSAGASHKPVSAVAEGGSGGLSNTQDETNASGLPGPGVGDTDSPGLTGNSDSLVVNNSEHGKEKSKTNEVTEEAPNKTTTTTKTKAPTTTTTTTTQPPTTTTTTAPEAPGNTARNAEAPTTTTTRAPSRLREIDGSLSSSAWVCAPLVLAVSALAYTALG
ncbi:putative mucin TcMUCII [Trypanosoma cruzi]|nr:putative mucin TcMUCII [Trypanosoma cruzi]